MSLALTGLYNKVLTSEPYISKSSLVKKYARAVLNEAISTSFTTDTIDRDLWTPLERELYYTSVGGIQLGKESKGHKGELSCVLLLLRLSSNPEHRKDYATIAEYHSSGREFAQIVKKYTGGAGDTSAFDITLGDGSIYEVKEATPPTKSKRGGEVQIGAESMSSASMLLRKLNTLRPIIEAFKNIPTPEKYIPTNLLKKLLIIKDNKPYKVFKSETATKEVTPVLVSIDGGGVPTGLNVWLKDFAADLEEFLQSDREVTNEPLSDTAQWVKDIYTDYYSRQPEKNIQVSDIDAKIIDTKAKEVLDKSFKKDPISAFVEACEASIYKSVETYQKEYYNSFIQGTEQSKKILEEILPNTGLFFVTSEGWLYTGKNHLTEVAVPVYITRSLLKIRRTR